MTFRRPLSEIQTISADVRHRVHRGRDRDPYRIVVRFSLPARQFEVSRFEFQGLQALFRLLSIVFKPMNITW